MRLMHLRTNACHALFHVMQQGNTLLRDLDLLDLHQITVRCVNNLFTHGLKSSCQPDELEQAIQSILGGIVTVATPPLPHALAWQNRYREGLYLELVAKLNQALALVQAYRELPDVADGSTFIYTAEGLLGHDPLNPNAHGWDGKVGTGPWG